MRDVSISKQVKEHITRIEPGAIFELKDFSEISNSQVVALELSRLSKKGEIERLTKGKYFVPRSNRFGKLGPAEWQILDKIIKENGGYFAGNFALNRIGATTQVPAVITIRGARSTRKLQIGHLTIYLKKQGNQDADYKQSLLTDIIEAARLIKKVPDGSTENTLARVTSSLKSRSKDEISSLVDLLKNERPYVRAIIGALLENIDKSVAQNIKMSLNPLTKYKIGIAKNLLPNKEKWGIV